MPRAEPPPETAQSQKRRLRKGRLIRQIGRVEYAKIARPVDSVRRSVAVAGVELTLR